MAQRALACVLLLVSLPSMRSDRWSRQISPYSDFSDWVPLPGPGPVERQLLPPIKRQAVAEPRILSEPVFPGFTRPTGFNQDFNRNFFGQASNRQLYLQSVPAVPSAPQNYLTDQGFSQANQGFVQNLPSQQFSQGIRFGLSQPNFPLTQGFVGPQFTFDSNPSKLKPSVVLNPIRFENAPKQDVPLSPQAKPFVPLPPKKTNPPMFVDGYRAENGSDYGMKNKKPISLQKLKYDVPKTEMLPPPNQAKSEKEEVQLLYVPLESLNRGSFNFRSIPSPHHLNSDQYNQNPPRPSPPKQPFASEYQRPQAVLENFGTDQDFFKNLNSYNNNKNLLDQIPKYSTISNPFPTSPLITPKPKKLKPHQPPLAIFSAQEAKRGSQLKVGDVLALLKNAPSVPVLDVVNPATAPKVFIGPSNLNAPDSYVKFELPYLSNIDNREKKLHQLPFFVAPLSYNTPQGFSKIPFPPPHVGSVVINSQIKDAQPPTAPSTIATPVASVFPNSYSTSQYKKPDKKVEQKPATAKPTFSYYSTVAPKTNPPPNYQSNFYTFEPQQVSTLRTPKEPQPSAITPPRQHNYYSFEPQTVSSPRPTKEPQASVTAPRQPPPRQPATSRQPTAAPRQPGSYYLRDQEQYNPSQVNFPENKLQDREPDKYVTKPETTTARHTVSTTTTKPSTYPSQLLETHNPYSINQAFHFSTPLDYHSLYEEAYSPKVSPPPPPSISSPSSTVTPSIKTSSVVTEENYQSPNYLQNYSPEIHYQDEKYSSQPPLYNNEYTNKPEVSSEYSPSVSTVNENTQSLSNLQEDKSSVKTQAPENTDNSNRGEYQQTEEATKSPYYQYDITNYEINKEQQQSSSQTTPSTTTTTRKSTIRNRGRPRYTTTPRSDSSDSTSRTVTRRPLRERKPATRPRYDTNKATEKTTSTSKAAENENTTKYSRGRTRGRIQPNRATTEKESEDGETPGRGRTQYKASASDDYYGKTNSGRFKTKEQDLAYQRDVLHQNYPVTLQERTSTKDIDAITDPSPRISSTRNLEPVTEVYDTENAYSYDRASISHQVPNLNLKEEGYVAQTEASYLPSYSATWENDDSYRSGVPLVETESTNDDTPRINDEDIYARQTSETPKLPAVSLVTESTNVETEQSSSTYSVSNEYSTKTEETTANPEQENKVSTPADTNHEEPEDNSVQTTPSYNRVRVRPGVIRQYHQASSTESTKTKIERRRPSQPVTYRPAYNQRRTTMRIEEIEHDFKTKQVHVRPEIQEINRHPVYRPEPTTEPSATTQALQDSTKRSVFRRRRPAYSTTTTEGSVEKTNKKAAFEVKSRFRSRRPADRTTEKSETDSTTTARNILHSRYSNRPKFSERFNKKSQEEEQEDQETNYSFNRPKYIEPEGELWSPKISTDSFKPYNPNDIVDDTKVTTTEQKSDFGLEEDIITAKNEYDDILLTVTPASNNVNNQQGKKAPSIPPTLEALVEQTKTTKNDSDNMSTFETMLEEVMKSLEEQDENEYSTNVRKNKGGEIGEIPPENVISSGSNEKKTTVAESEHSEQYTTTIEPTGADDFNHENETSQKSRRRGYWKKVKKVRPVTESIETAESQYYANTVNRLGSTINFPSKNVHDKEGKHDKPGTSFKPKVTTYKPNFQIIRDIINSDIEDLPLDEIMPVFDIPKIGKEVEKKQDNKTESVTVSNEVKNEVKADVNSETTPEFNAVVKSEVKPEIKTTEANIEKETPTEIYPGDLDLGTGSPDSTIMDVSYHSTSTVPTFSTHPTERDYEDKSDGFSFMDYFFGYSANGNNDKEDSDKTEPIQNQNDDEEPIVRNSDETAKQNAQTEEHKYKITTTESSYIPEEFTATNDDRNDDDNIGKIESEFEIKKLQSTDKPNIQGYVTEEIKKNETVGTVTPSSFMDPSNVMSTSMSTEVSHETEICFRGKCIKTSKDIL